MIIFFFIKIKYIIEHWRPIIAGLLIYGSVIPFLLIQQGYYYSSFPIIIGVGSLLGLHFLLNWLYNNGYSPKSALAIMGGVPVVIITLLLPFLKMNFDFGDFFDVHHYESNDFHYDGYNEEDIVALDGDNPDSHYVEPYYRDDGTYVEGHWRTNPDGIEENNFSYKE